MTSGKKSTRPKNVSVRGRYSFKVNESSKKNTKKRSTTTDRFRTFPGIAEDPERTLITEISQKKNPGLGNAFFDNSDESAEKLTKLKENFSTCLFDYTKNQAGIDFENFIRRLSAIGFLRLNERRITILKTKNHFFLFTDVNPTNIQDDHITLMNADFSKTSILRSQKGKTLYLTVVTYNDLMKLQNAKSRTSDIFEITENDYGDLYGSLFSRDDGEFDLATFQERLRCCQKAEGGIYHVNPKEIADKVTYVEAFVDDDGIGKYYLACEEEDGSDAYYELHIYPQEPDDPDYSNPCFKYGKEFCVLYGPE